MDLKEALEQGLKALEQKLTETIAKYEGQLRDAGTVSTECRAEVKTLAEQFKTMKDQLGELMQKAASMPGQTQLAVSIGQQFVTAPQFKELVEGRSNKIRVEVKSEVKNTVVSDSTTTFPTQRPGVIQGNFQPLTIRELLTFIPVTSNQVNSLREKTWTNSAAEVSQGAAKNQSDIEFEPYDVPIRTIAHWIKVSNQLLADAPAIAAYIDTRLRDGLAQRVDNQLLNGNGTSPNVSGMTDSGNYTAYTPTSDDLLVDAINRAKYTLWALGIVPDTVIVNPAAWGAMERTRESAGGGQYLYGAPGMAAGINPFGLRIVLSANMAASKFLVGGLRPCVTGYDRQQVTVEMGYVNDDFTKNLVTIRAEERLGLGIERPSGLLYGDFTA